MGFLPASPYNKVCGSGVRCIALWRAPGGADRRPRPVQLFALVNRRAQPRPCARPRPCPPDQHPRGRNLRRQGRDAAALQRGARARAAALQCPFGAALHPRCGASARRARARPPLPAAPRQVLLPLRHAARRRPCAYAMPGWRRLAPTLRAPPLTPPSPLSLAHTRPQVVNTRLSPNCKARLTVENDDRASLFRSARPPAHIDTPCARTAACDHGSPPSGAPPSARHPRACAGCAQPIHARLHTHGNASHPRSVRDLLAVHEATGIPIVFDYHHHWFCPGGMSEREAFEAAIATWPQARALDAWRAAAASAAGRLVPASHPSAGVARTQTNKRAGRAPRGALVREL